jgi:cyclophilin family peptidyl-prolyl cis-trans isomerase
MKRESMCCMGLLFAVTQLMLFRVQFKHAQLDHTSTPMQHDLSGFSTSQLSHRNEIRCETTKGYFNVELRPDLAPHGVKRIREMVEIGFFNQGIAFFRVNNWLTQFGADQDPRNRMDGNDPFKLIRSDSKPDVHPDLIASAGAHQNISSTGPASAGGVSPTSSQKRLPLTPWVRGTLALIGRTQMVVVIRPNPHMGTQGHDAPAGFVTQGMDTVFDRLYRYNDIIDNPKGDPGPNQIAIAKEGMAYIHREFPHTDFIKSCWFI